jgi:hypothetical protein
MEFTLNSPWRFLFSGPNRNTRIRSTTSRIRQRTIAPRLEVLEERCMPSLTPTDGGATVFSSVTQTHWLANANMAGTINPDGSNNHFHIKINADGSMTFSQAQEWVYKLNNVDNGVGKPMGYLGHSNWILPDHFAGAGFNTASSDLEELFYNEFGCYPGESIAQITPPYFHNFQPYLYWDGDEVAPGGGEFSFGNGFQGTTIKEDTMYVIPEYSDNTQAAAEPKSVNGIKPPDSYPPVSNSLVKSSDGKTVYDKALDITWLADANSANENTFGISHVPNTSPKDPNYIPINVNPDGSMNYATAVAWIGAMNSFNNGKGYLGHNNWRLPMAEDPTATYYMSGSGIGDEFQGSEMGELYYTELGATAGSTILQSPTTTPGTSTVGPFVNFQPYLYWAGTATAASEGHGNGHSTFSFGNGLQGGNIDTNEMYVIPVFDGPRKVTSASDDGIGSLRSVIKAAHAGDLIDLSGLTGQTITLNSEINLSLDDESADKVLNIQGPGAGKLTISGNNQTRIFFVGPYPLLKNGNLDPANVVASLPATIISGVTLANGLSGAGYLAPDEPGQGGAIFDDGVSLTLSSDMFSYDQAVCGLFAAAAKGGALAILGGPPNLTEFQGLSPTVGVTVAVTDCQFSNDTAIGRDQSLFPSPGSGGAIWLDAGVSTDLTLSVDGTAFSGDSATGGSGADGTDTYSPKTGGPGDGGAVHVDADHAIFPVFSFSSDTFSDCSAFGGSGGNGAADDSGQDGAKGGQARGGAIYYTAGGALVPNLKFAVSTFTSNVATAGNGGAGGDAKTRAGSGGAAGKGGEGLGGALFADLARSVLGFVVLHGDTLSLNTSQGGNGGTGGSGGKAATGGAGGAGGLAGGGAIACTVSGTAHSAGLDMEQSAVSENTAMGGHGGAGGTGQDGGRGGNGAGSRGAGIYMNSFGRDSDAFWTLYQVIVEANDGYSGNGGKGGDGSNVGGNGGNSKNSLGGGIYDAFAGTLDLYQCMIESNDLEDGAGGSGGNGSTTGGNGQDSVSRGGGLYIHPKARARATADTVISGNDADRRREVFGTLGMT